MTAAAPAQTCRCDKVGLGEWRAFELPPDFDASLETLAGDPMRWACVRRCLVCGQYWHDFHRSSGHAEIPVLEMVDRERAEVLMGTMVAPNPSIAEGPMPSAPIPVEIEPDRTAADARPLAGWIALVLIGLGTIAAFYEALTGDDSPQVIGFGSVCFVLGIGLALFGPVRR